MGLSEYTKMLIVDGRHTGIHCKLISALLRKFCNKSLENGIISMYYIYVLYCKITSKN